MIRATTFVSDTSQSIIADTVVLDREDRHRRRMAMTGEGGLAFLLDLAEATVLADGAGSPLHAVSRSAPAATTAPAWARRAVDGKGIGLSSGGAVRAG